MLITYDYTNNKYAFFKPNMYTNNIIIIIVQMCFQTINYKLNVKNVRSIE